MGLSIDDFFISLLQKMMSGNELGLDDLKKKMMREYLPDENSDTDIFVSFYDLLDLLSAYKLFLQAVRDGDTGRVHAQRMLLKTHKKTSQRQLVRVLDNKQHNYHLFFMQRKPEQDNFESLTMNKPVVVIYHSKYKSLEWQYVIYQKNANINTGKISDILAKMIEKASRGKLVNNNYLIENKNIEEIRSVLQKDSSIYIKESQKETNDITNKSYLKSYINAIDALLSRQIEISEKKEKTQEIIEMEMMELFLHLMDLLLTLETKKSKSKATLSPSLFNKVTRTKTTVVAHAFESSFKETMTYKLCEKLLNVIDKLKIDEEQKKEQEDDLRFMILRIYLHMAWQDRVNNAMDANKQLDNKPLNLTLFKDLLKQAKYFKKLKESSDRAEKFYCLTEVNPITTADTTYQPKSHRSKLNMTKSSLAVYRQLLLLQKLQKSTENIFDYVHKDDKNYSKEYSKQKEKIANQIVLWQKNMEVLLPHEEYRSSISDAEALINIGINNILADLRAIRDAAVLQMWDNYCNKNRKDFIKYNVDTNSTRDAISHELTKDPNMDGNYAYCADSNSAAIAAFNLIGLGNVNHKKEGGLKKRLTNAVFNIHTINLEEIHTNILKIALNIRVLSGMLNINYDVAANLAFMSNLSKRYPDLLKNKKSTATTTYTPDIAQTAKMSFALLQHLFAHDQEDDSIQKNTVRKIFTNWLGVNQQTILASDDATKIHLLVTACFEWRNANFDVEMTGTLYGQVNKIVIEKLNGIIITSPPPQPRQRSDSDYSDDDEAVDQNRTPEDKYTEYAKLFSLSEDKARNIWNYCNDDQGEQLLFEFSKHATVELEDPQRNKYRQ